MKSIITAEEHAALSADLQKEYAKQEEGDGYALTLEGEPPKGFTTQARLDEFRQNNIKLLKDMDTFKAADQGQKEEIANLKKQLEDGQQQQTEGKTEMEKLTDRLTRLEEANATKDQQLAERDKALAERDFESKFASVFGATHVKEHLREDALTRARRAGWDLTEDRKALTNGERDPDDPTKDLAPEAWATANLPKEFSTNRLAATTAPAVVARQPMRMPSRNCKNRGCRSSTTRPNPNRSTPPVADRS